MPPDASHYVSLVRPGRHPVREFFIDNLLVQIHLIIEMILWTGLAPWDFEFPFPGRLMYTFPTCTGAGGDGEEQPGGRGVPRRAATVSSRKKMVHN